MKRMSFNYTRSLVVLFLLTVSMAASAQAADKLVVKDSEGTNTVFSVDETGKLITKKIGVGNSNPLSTMHLTEENVNFDRGLTVGQHYSSASAGTIQIKRSRGTAATPLAVINGDNIVGFHGQVYDGSSYIVPVSIIYQVDGAVSTGSAPSAMIFKTGTINPTPERMRISSSGKVTIKDLAGTYANGSAYVCVNNAGEIYASEAACP